MASCNTIGLHSEATNQMCSHCTAVLTNQQDYSARICGVAVSTSKKFGHTANELLRYYSFLDPSAAEFAEKTSLAENPPEKNAASRKSAE